MREMCQRIYSGLFYRLRSEDDTFYAVQWAAPTCLSPFSCYYGGRVGVGVEYSIDAASALLLDSHNLDQGIYSYD